MGFLLIFNRNHHGNVFCGPYRVGEAIFHGKKKGHTCGTEKERKENGRRVKENHIQR